MAEGRSSALDENPYQPLTTQQPKQRSYTLVRTICVVAIIVFAYLSSVAIRLLVQNRGEPVRHLATLAAFIAIIAIELGIFVRTFRRQK